MCIACDATSYYLSNALTSVSATMFKAPQPPLLCRVSLVVFSMTIYRRSPLLFLILFSLPPLLNFVLVIKKSILSFYFMTFHIWPSMFSFLNLILSIFIKFYFIFNFIIGSIIFNLISLSLVHILLIFIFYLDSFMNLIFFFNHTLQFKV